MKFFECSARTRQNVDEAFLTLARDVVGRLLAGGNGGYYLYATRSNTAPGNDATNPTAANQANYVNADGQYAVTQSTTLSPSQNYLTDVGAQDGPIDFLLGTHRPEVVRSALEAYAGAHPGGAVPTEDRFFPPHAGNGYDDAPDKIPLSYDVLFPHLLATLTGGAGTSFIADTFALHRGTPPTRHHRLACWIRYGLSRHRIYELDRNEPVPASRLGARLPGGREAEWITRLIVDRSR